MEMVSTAKMKKLQVRAIKLRPYSQKIDEVISNLCQSKAEVASNPLLQVRKEVKSVAILMITGNRGLCGGFNSNIIDNTLKFKAELEKKGSKVDLLVVGKKGASYLKFIKITPYETIVNLEDKVTYNDIINLGEKLSGYFVSGNFDEVYISYVQIISAATQKPKINKLLPIDIDNFQIKSAGVTDYIFEPNTESILNTLLPLSVKIRIYQSILETSFSEQFARRISMKNATDAANDMVRDLTISYNRIRQAKITKEIAEIVGGAAALE